MREQFLTDIYMTDDMIIMFADKMVNFFMDNPEVMHINKYHISQGITHNMYQGWLSRSEYLKIRHEHCKALIGLRREEKLAQHDPKTLTHTLHLYSEDWKRANEDHARQKEKFRSNDRDIKVIFPGFNQEQPKIEEKGDN